MTASVFQRAGWLREFLSQHPQVLGYLRQIRRSGCFDRAFYLGVNPGLHPLFRAFPERHYVIFGEREGRQPNPDFSPGAYLRHNPDLGDWTARPFLHFLRYGRHENRLTHDLPQGADTGLMPAPVLRPPQRETAPYAIVVHVYYHELWEEIATRLRSLDIPFDLFVTVTDKGDTEGAAAALAKRIGQEFPGAIATAMPNRGRDIFPFIHLLNADLLRPYRAVAKIHTKRSPHRTDGDHWRTWLIDGILPGKGTAAALDRFLSDPNAGVWVADGQNYRDPRWWGSNLDITAWLLRRAQIRVDPGKLEFPAGSMYWLKPGMIAMMRGLRLDQSLFETECGQVDGTLAHAFERSLGYLAAAVGLSVRETGQLPARPPMPAPATRPAYVSAFYLPQFHRTPENDRWWGRGFTEWQAAIRARPAFDGHAQPLLPGELGFYDLTRPTVMGEQAALARSAGIDAFCVYHYWFDGRRMLEAPLDRLLDRPEIDFPFYLCWANESWRRNWDGLSGEVLLDQSYAEGFEAGLVQGTLPYMRDPRYQRAAGIGEVELGAVRFHLTGPAAVPPELFDFWVEMPPHGLVEGEDFLFGGEQGNRLPAAPVPEFRGLIYDIDRVIARSLSPEHAARLPANTIAGAMPGWDNSPRRATAAHLAYGAHPGAFIRWLEGLGRHRIAGSYRNELFLNAWNEWAEGAVMEPTQIYGTAYLDALRRWRFGPE